MNKGKIKQIIGSVLDISFDSGNMPEIYNAVEIQSKVNGKDVTITAEVQQHIGDNTVRAISLQSTDGLKRGLEVVDTGAPISVPVGTKTLGRIFNVLGEVIDEMGDLPKDVQTRPIHRNAPSYEEIKPKTEIFETGIKVIDLLAPYIKGVKLVYSVVLG